MQPGSFSCGIALPQYINDQDQSLSLIRSFAPRAEQLGFDSLWVLEGIVSKYPTLEPVSLLSHAAALTERIRLGVAVIVLTLRNPLQLAKSLATLDRLSGGRLTAGVGLGGRDHEPLFGYSGERRVTRFEESLAVMRTLWREKEASFRGHFWEFEKVPMEPKPLQKPGIPVWFGGRAAAAVRRAVRLGDGFMGAGSSSSQEFIQQAGWIRQHLEEFEREPETFPISKRVYLAIDNDRDRAERRLREWFQGFYGNADLAPKVAIFGSGQECLDRLSELVEGGAQHLMLNPVFDELEQMEILAEDIVPKL